MARGITNRMRLSMPPAEEGNEEYQHSLEQWANRLPLGRCGFRYGWTATYAPVTVSGTRLPLTFDTRIDDTDGFGLALGAQTSFKIPADCGGTYMIVIRLPLASLTIPTEVTIANGANITIELNTILPLNGNALALYGTCTFLMMFSSGDVFTVKIRQSSGAGATYPASALAAPTFNGISCYRISL